MYTKAEIKKIYFNCKNIDDFEAVTEAFIWAIDNYFMAPNDFLHRVSIEAFNKLS